jgi:hypothetical protein
VSPAVVIHQIAERARSRYYGANATGLDADRLPGSKPQ